MTATLCATCGALLTTPFCRDCARPTPKAPGIDVALAGSDPVAGPHAKALPANAREPGAAPPPPYGPPAVVRQPISAGGARVWWAIGALVALLVCAVGVGFAVGTGSSRAPVATTPPPRASLSATASWTAPQPAQPLSNLDPGTRSSLVPAWANRAIGRLIRAEIVLGATGTAVFASPGRNVCAVIGSHVSCVATPMWHPGDAEASPPLDPGCSAAPDGRWSVFTIGPVGPATASGCSSKPAALFLGGGTTPSNKVIGMGSSGILCYIDVRKGAAAARTGVACWNPASNHGFMITNGDMRLW